MSQRARAGGKKFEATARQLSDNEREQVAKGYTLDRMRRVEEIARTNRSTIPVTTKEQHGEAASLPTVFAVLRQFASHTDQQGVTFAKPALIGRECLLGNGGKTVAAITRALKGAGLLVPTRVHRYGKEIDGLYVPWAVGGQAGDQPTTRESVQTGGPAGGPTGGPAGGPDSTVSPDESTNEGRRAQGVGRRYSDLLPDPSGTGSADATPEPLGPHVDSDAGRHVTGESQPADTAPDLVGEVSADPAADAWRDFEVETAHWTAYGSEFDQRTISVTPKRKYDSSSYRRVPFTSAEHKAVRIVLNTFKDDPNTVDVTFTDNEDKAVGFDYIIGENPNLAEAATAIVNEAESFYTMEMEYVK